MHFSYTLEIRLGSPYMAHCPVAPCRITSCREDRNRVYPRGTARWANVTYCELSPISFRSSKLYSHLISLTWPYDWQTRLWRWGSYLSLLRVPRPGRRGQRRWCSCATSGEPCRPRERGSRAVGWPGHCTGEGSEGTCHSLWGSLSQGEWQKRSKFILRRQFIVCAHHFTISPYLLTLQASWLTLQPKTSQEE